MKRKFTLKDLNNSARQRRGTMLGKPRIIAIDNCLIIVQTDWQETCGAKRILTSLMFWKDLYKPEY